MGADILRACPNKSFILKGRVYFVKRHNGRFEVPPTNETENKWEKKEEEEPF